VLRNPVELPNLPSGRPRGGRPRSRRIAPRTITAALLGTSLLLASTARAQTVDDVVRRYVEARGGLARLHAVQTLRLTGTLELPGVSAPYVLELKRPNKMRTEFTVEGQKGIQAFDGHTAWKQLPLPGESPRVMDPDEAADARAQADVDLSPLVDAAAKGYAVELEGRDRLPGGETFKLIVQGREGPPRTVHIDTRTHLVVEALDRRQLDGKSVEFVTEIGDYRNVGGLEFPHRLEVGPRNAPEQRQRLVLDKVEVNPPLDDSRFSMPSAPAGRGAHGRRNPAVLP
jgi:outer membrane lipoprotein-sorting protein